MMLFSAVISQGGNFICPFADLVDIEKEIDRLKGEENVWQESWPVPEACLAMRSLSAGLRKQRFAEERAKLEKYEQMMEQVRLRLAQLQ